MIINVYLNNCICLFVYKNFTFKTEKDTISNYIIYINFSLLNHSSNRFIEMCEQLFQLIQLSLKHCLISVAAFIIDLFKLN